MMSNPTDDERSAGEQRQEPPTVPEPVGASTPETWTDPTAPVWSEQTSALPTPRTDDAPQDTAVWAAPPPPSAPTTPAPESGFAAPSTAWAAPPANPYGYSAEQPGGSTAPPQFPQPTSATATDYQGPQSAPAQGYPAHGQPYGQAGQPVPTYGQGAYGQGGSPYANPSPNNVSAIVLTIVAGLTMLSSCFVIGTPSLVLGIMALSAQASDPQLSRKRARIGWIVYGVNWAVAVLLLIVALILVVAFSETGSGNPNSF